MTSKQQWERERRAIRRLETGMAIGLASAAGLAVVVAWFSGSFAVLGAAIALGAVCLILLWNMD